jgi:hypothetical protein
MRIPSVRSLLALMPALLLGACQTQIPAHEFMPNAARDKVSSTETVLPIKQSEIYVFVPQSNVAAAGGGGLLLALIDAGVDSVRTSKAETAVKPLRDALIDYSFDQSLQNSLKVSLAQDTWLHAGDGHVVREVTAANLDSVLAGSKSDAVLFTTTDYQLSNDADQLTVTMIASLFPNSDALRAIKPAKDAKTKTALNNTLYHNRLVFQAYAPVLGVDRDHAITAWSANHGQAMRAVLDEAASKLASMLAADLNRPEGDVDTGTGAEVKTNNVTGHVITKDADGGVVRYGDGTLAYMPNSMLDH